MKTYTKTIEYRGHKMSIVITSGVKSGPHGPEHRVTYSPNGATPYRTVPGRLAKDSVESEMAWKSAVDRALAAEAEVDIVARALGFAEAA